MKPIEVIQYETGIQLVFEVQDIELDPSATATLFVRKPSGKFVFQEDNVTLTENTVVIDLHNQALTEFGHPFFQIKFKKDEEVISTYSGMLSVEKSLDDSGAEESKTVLAAFEELTDEQIARVEEATRAQVDLVKAEIEAKGETVLATIPNEYTEMYNRVNTLFSSVANAIKGTVSGSVVRVDDVSPVEHKPVVKVHGKNIFNPDIIDELYEANGLTIARSGDKIIINGTSTKDHSCPVIDMFQPITKGETYTCTVYRVSGVGGDVVASFGLGTKSSVRDEFYDCTSVAANASDYRVFTAHYEHLTRFLLYFKEGATYTDFVCKIQLEKGGVSTEYTPYIDPTTVTVTADGVNYTPKADGTVEGIPSTALSGGISTDNEGITIECEYNKDTGKVIEKLTNAVVALGGVV